MNPWDDPYAGRAQQYYNQYWGGAPAPTTPSQIPTPQAQTPQWAQPTAPYRTLEYRVPPGSPTYDYFVTKHGSLDQAVGNPGMVGIRGNSRVGQMYGGGIGGYTFADPQDGTPADYPGNKSYDPRYRAMTTAAGAGNFGPQLGMSELQSLFGGAVNTGRSGIANSSRWAQALQSYMQRMRG